jgi:Ca2+-binding RTX toxin-like protein
VSHDKDPEDVQVGTDGNDVMHARSTDIEHIFGMGGDDVIYLSTDDANGDLGYRETAYGNDGNDQIYGGSHYNTLYGGSGDDLLETGKGQHFLYGGAGNDRLDGTIGYGDWALYEGAAGGVVVSLLLQGTAQDTRGDGIDTLIGIENLGGSNFNDILRGDAGANRLEGGEGDDLLRGGAGNDDLQGRRGVDTVTYRDAEVGVRVVLAFLEGRSTGYQEGWFRDNITDVENVEGSRFSDHLTGGEIANELSGWDGSDRLLGMDGDDVVSGGSGTDSLNGGLADDVLDGGLHNDRLYGEDGHDVLNGGDGADYLAGGRGVDLLDGGAHNDRLTGFIDADRLLGRDGDDLMNGGSGNDHLDGGSGADRVLGGNGVDVLRGGDGDDALSGGIGRDVLTGGAGSDMFIFRDGDTGATARAADTIRDFDGNGDRVNLRSVDAIAGGEDDKFSFIGTDAFSGDAGELRYQVIDGNTFVQGDIDGDKVADLMVRLDGLHDLTGTDFVL